LAAGAASLKLFDLLKDAAKGEQWLQAVYGNGATISGVARITVRR